MLFTIKFAKNIRLFKKGDIFTGGFLQIDKTSDTKFDTTIKLDSEISIYPSMFCDATLSQNSNFKREVKDMKFSYQQTQTVFDNFDFSDLLSALNNFDLKIQDFNSESTKSYERRFGEEEYLFSREFLNKTSL